MDPITLVSITVLGLVVGLLVGLTSVGSGALMTPVLLLDFSSVLARGMVVGVATTQGTVSKFVASAYNYYKRALKADYLLMISITGVPLASVGAFYSSALIRWNLFQPLLAGVLLLVGVIIIAQHKLKKINLGKDPEMTVGLRVKGIVIGMVVGTIAGLTGVSTGSILVASLILLLKFPNRTAVNVAIFEGGFILLAATITQLYLGNVDLIFTAMLLMGGIPGILLGNHYKSKVDQKLLGYGIAIAIIIEAARTLSSFFLGKSFLVF